MKQNNILQTGTFSQLFFRMCIPSIVTIFVMILYNMADLFFIGMTKQPILVTSVALSMPVFTVVQAIGSLFGNGGCSAAALALGNGDTEKARKISSFTLLSALSVGLLLMLLIQTNMNGILRLLGADGDAAPHAAAYLRILSLGAPVLLLSGVSANLVRANGSAHISMLGNGLGTITNIILDPILILGFDLGIQGAAIATVIGNAFACAYLLFQIMKTSSPYTLSPKYFTLKKDISLHVISLGWASTVSILLQTLASILFNRQLVTYGNNAVAAMSVASRAGFLIAMLQMGITIGIQPAISFNYGAKNAKRVMMILKRTATLTFILGCILTFLSFIFRENLMRAFVQDQDIVSLGSNMVMAGILAGPISGIYQLSTGFLQSTGRASLAALTAALRQGFVFIPLLYLLSRIAGLKGIIFVSSLSDVIACLIALGIAFVPYRQLRNSSAQIDNTSHLRSAAS